MNSHQHGLSACCESDKFAPFDADLAMQECQQEDGSAKSPGEELYDKYTGFFAPEVGTDRLDCLEHRMTQQVVRFSVSRLFDTVGAIVGVQSLERRLADLACHSPFEVPVIPIAYVQKPLHSHNMLVGVPYGGVYLGRFQQTSFISAHEFGHVIFGKFNDGITEPLASLFVVPPDDDKPNESQQTGGKDPCKAERTEQELRPPDLVTLAAIELFEDGVRLADLGSIGDLFSHRPMDRVLSQLRYEYEKKQGRNPADAAAATQEYICRLVRSEYAPDFVAHSSLRVTRLDLDEQIALERWEKRHGTEASRARAFNPNETKGVVRNFQGQIDGTLIRYLLEVGLPEGESPTSCTIEGARQSIHQLLRFYYDPEGSLCDYEWADFDEMQRNLREHIRNRYQRYLKDAFAWYQLIDDLRESPCYQPGSWDDEECRSKVGISDAGGPVEKFYRSLPNDRGGRRRRGTAHPVVLKARCGIAEGENEFSLVERLGEDLDFETYFGLP